MVPSPLGTTAALSLSANCGPRKEAHTRRARPRGSQRCSVQHDDHRCPIRHFGESYSLVSGTKSNRPGVPRRSTSESTNNDTFHGHSHRSVAGHSRRLPWPSSSRTRHSGRSVRIIHRGESSTSGSLGGLRQSQLPIDFELLQNLLASFKIIRRNRQCLHELSTFLYLPDKIGKIESLDPTPLD
jgi:hypothetical protein